MFPAKPREVPPQVEGGVPTDTGVIQSLGLFTLLAWGQWREGRGFMTLNLQKNPESNTLGEGLV